MNGKSSAGITHNSLFGTFLSLVPFQSQFYFSFSLLFFLIHFLISLFYTRCHSCLCFNSFQYYFFHFISFIPFVLSFIHWLNSPFISLIKLKYACGAKKKVWQWWKRIVFVYGTGLTAFKKYTYCNGLNEVSVEAGIGINKTKEIGKTFTNLITSYLAGIGGLLLSLLLPSNIARSASHSDFVTYTYTYTNHLAQFICSYQWQSPRKPKWCTELKNHFLWLLLNCFDIKSSIRYRGNRQSEWNVTPILFSFVILFEFSGVISRWSHWKLEFSKT